jgi:hypothetical protein
MSESKNFGAKKNIIFAMVILALILLSAFEFQKETDVQKREALSKRKGAEVFASKGVLKEISKREEVSTADNGLGIAAGGGLVYMNQEQLDGYFKDLKDLGATWVRWDVDWSAIQPQDSGDYEWSGADRVAATAQKYGIRSLGVITYAPNWARKGVCESGKHCPPDSPDTFSHFAGEAAKRYEGIIDYWEIWNEPNYNLFWYPKPDAESYAKLLKASYVEIKKANPAATVISGGLAIVAEERGENIPPISFIKYLYESNMQDYFDAIALHPYTYPVLPESAENDSGWQQMDLIRQFVKDHAAADKKIWITEYGAPTDGTGNRHETGTSDFKYNSDYMSENAQAEMAKEAAVIYDQDKQWMGPFFWYGLRDSGQGSSMPENFFGLIRPDGGKKPAYETLKNIFINK